LKQDPSLIKSAIEEFLRYDGPVETSTNRYALEDFELWGEKISKGERVIAVLADADHDPAQFADPDILDITRANNQHVAFGYGIHYCLGAPLARLEGQIAITSLLARFPDLHLAVSPEQLQWRPGTLLRGLQKL